MNQELNDFLEQNLIEAHAIFINIVNEMKNSRIPYDYDVICDMEEKSFTKVRTLISKMNLDLREYLYLTNTNADFLDEKYTIYLKYFILYIISMIFVKFFSDIIKDERFNDYWQYLVGMFLGSTYMSLLNKDVLDSQSDTKEKRDVINKIKTLKEEYKINHDTVVNEIDYIFALNDNMWDELDKGKRLVKNN